MNLDFAALSRPPQEQPARKPWGQVGTVGTQASMRVSTPVGGGDKLGTGGDSGTLMTTTTYTATDTGGPVSCPQASPPCPHMPLVGNANEINMSPVSPLVPSSQGMCAVGDEFEHEAFEERAAIMEFEGGLTRAEAEAAALLCPATTVQPRIRAVQERTSGGELIEGWR